jgi:hypothetical protein
MLIPLVFKCDYVNCPPEVGKKLLGTRGEREFRAFWSRFLGVLFLDVLFLDPRSSSLVFGRFVLGVPRSSGLVFGRFILGAPDPRSWILVPGFSFF